MRTVMANLWHPIGGVSITDIGEKRILFRFYCEVDRDRVLKGSPWIFNNHLLLISMLKEDDNPLEVHLHQAGFWVQLHNLPSDLYSENMARQFGDFIGSFVDYDSKAILAGLQNFMRIRVLVDVRKPLKRRKKLLIAKSKECIVSFKYEKLTTFCFLCGRLGHGESFCPIRMTQGSKELPFGWDISLKALPRRTVVNGSPWLRESNSDWGSMSGVSVSNQVSFFMNHQSPNLICNYGAVLGLNLMGKSLSPSDNSFNEEDIMGEGGSNADRPLLINEGKKRLRSSGIPMNSLSHDSFDLQGDQIIRCPNNNTAEPAERCISFHHVDRRANMVAHMVVKERMVIKEDRFWVEDLPAAAEVFLARDLSGLR
ncbi:hypothetical protein J1N35_033684 [Gossypium stocksii]|uniref:CCHC-type domain-containing protein n=1 Tax=Gossypium stocksii TaxID=47602 RepID=A0A9D3URG9_9ROSI|nr:hypothetical protein J1N35_033684 [Gossypium stocksii]